MKREPLKVKAVLVQCEPMDEHHSDVAPWGGAMSVFDLDMKFDAVGAANILWFAAQLTQPKSPTRRDALPQPSTDNHSLSREPRRGTDRGGQQGGPGHGGPMRGVHWSAPPR